MLKIVRIFVYAWAGWTLIIAIGLFTNRDALYHLVKTIPRHYQNIEVEVDGKVCHLVGPGAEGILEQLGEHRWAKAKGVFKPSGIDRYGNPYWE